MKYLISMLLASLAGLAYAECTVNYVHMPDGKVMVCTTCCDFGTCTTNCR